MSEAKQWYYVRDEARIGPLTNGQLREAASNGVLRPSDMIWREGLPEWIPATKVKGLFPADKTKLGTEPPPLPRHKSPSGQAVVPELQAVDVVISYAGFWKRLAAYLIDWLVLLIPGFLLGFFVGLIMANDGASKSVIEVVANCSAMILWWLYSASMECSPLQGTLGKLALGIKVTDEKGSRIGFGRATARHFGKILSALMIGIGFLMAAFTSKKQALHDMMASCLVMNRTA